MDNVINFGDNVKTDSDNQKPSLYAFAMKDGTFLNLEGFLLITPTFVALLDEADTVIFLVPLDELKFQMRLSEEAVEAIAEATAETDGN